MKTEPKPAARQSFARRCIVPVAAVLPVMLIAWFVYNNSWWIFPQTAHVHIARAAGVLLFAGIGFGALLVYPLAYFRGASAGERIAASLATPLVWLVKELVRVSEFFSLGETLYYALSSVILLAVIGNIALMGLSEMICRAVLKRRGAAVKVLSPLPVFAVFLGIAGLYVILIWGLGVHYFYIYMRGYRALFQ